MTFGVTSVSASLQIPRTFQEMRAQAVRGQYPANTHQFEEVKKQDGEVFTSSKSNDLLSQNVLRLCLLQAASGGLFCKCPLLP